MSVKHTDITHTRPAWWSGMCEAEKYMKEVSDAIDRHLAHDIQARVDIYNRAYEAVCNAIRDARI